MNSLLLNWNQEPAKLIGYACKVYYDGKNNIYIYIYIYILLMCVLYYYSIIVL